MSARIADSSGAVNGECSFAVVTDVQVVAISPLTAEVLAELGHPAAAVAPSYTGDGVLNAILAANSR